MQGNVGVGCFFVGGCSVSFFWRIPSFHLTIALKFSLVVSLITVALCGLTLSIQQLQVWVQAELFNCKGYDDALGSKWLCQPGARWSCIKASSYMFYSIYYVTDKSRCKLLQYCISSMLNMTCSKISIISCIPTSLCYMKNFHEDLGSMCMIEILTTWYTWTFEGPLILKMVEWEGGQY